jgi:ATP-dependent exoDNAse (exonuclease V) beta subunit
MDIFEERAKQVAFDEESHTYLICGKKYDSVTSFIKSRFKFFDKKKEARKKSKALVCKYKKLVVENVSDRKEFRKYLGEFLVRKWHESTVKGKEIHKSIEMFLKGESNHGNNPVIKNVITFMEIHDLVPFKTETVIYHEEMQIAGTIDALFQCRKTGKYFLVDWKTTKKLGFAEWYYSNGQEPFEDIQYCKFNTFSLQLQMYRYILESKYNIEIEFCFIFAPKNDCTWTAHDANQFNMEKIAKYRINEVEKLNSNDFHSV